MFSRLLAVLATAAVTLALPARRASALWQPKIGDSWQIDLTDRIDVKASLTPDVGIFDFDLFVNSASDIAALQAQGKRVICYFSAGSTESNRPDLSFLSPFKGSTMEGWPDEHWLDVRQQGVRDVMAARIALAAANGCDAIDPDNVDGYDNKNGLGLTEDDAVDYVKFLSQEARKYNMGIGLKNAGSIAARVIDVVDFSVQEQCHQQGNCNDFNVFPNNVPPKPVFNIEYNVDDNGGKRDASCPTNAGFSSVIKNMNLDGFIQSCDGTTATTSTTTEDAGENTDVEANGALKMGGYAATPAPTTATPATPTAASSASSAPEVTAVAVADSDTNDSDSDADDSNSDDSDSDDSDSDDSDSGDSNDEDARDSDASSTAADPAKTSVSTPSPTPSAKHPHHHQKQ